MKLTDEQKSKIVNASFLITGGAGFIGSHIVSRLLEIGAKKVRVLDNLATGTEENISPFYAYSNFEFILGDIRDQTTCNEACKDIDYISHQAALGSVPRSIDDPITTNIVNINGHLNMLWAAKKNSIKRMVYAASSSTYGDSNSLPKIENVIGKPLSPYAVTKYVNELYADVFSRTYNMETIGLRYFNVFGPKQSPNGQYAAVIPLFVNAILDNVSPFINGDGTQTRDFTFVENVVQANLLSMLTDNSAAVNQVYNIACGERISLNKLFEIIKENAENHDIYPQYRNPRKGDIMDSLASIEKGTKLLGYNPIFNVKEGLKLTVDYWKEKRRSI
jgi:UDP-N-acetylglucosamine 4-epimerase